jgi:hypothetical protein
MAVDRRHTVLQTSLRTSAQALADPEPLQHLPRPMREREQNLTGMPDGLSGGVSGGLGEAG